MNCREFERTIIDLGFDHLIEVPTHAHALAHAETCAPCAARLNREQRMTAGLQAFAVKEAEIHAPERIRSALRAAFEEQQAAASPLPVSLSATRSKWLWGLAAAAMLLLAATTTALWLREQAKVDNALTMLPEPPMPRIRTAPPPSAFDDPPPSPGARPAGRRRTPPVKKSPETAAELFPLTYVAKSGPAEFVQTVRVEISRSTLLLMGLPINIDRGEGLIKADIIIGEDGVARAVRILN